MDTLKAFVGEKLPSAAEDDVLERPMCATGTLTVLVKQPPPNLAPIRNDNLLRFWIAVDDVVIDS